MSKPNHHQPSAKHDVVKTVWPFLLLIGVCFLFYRLWFNFPVWFDESVAKALFFGLPAWFYVVAYKFRPVNDTFSPARIKPGLLLGLAVGGMFGFVTSLFALISRGAVVEAAPLFASERFWYEFFLAILTGFWETLFFYSFIGSVIFVLYKKLALIWQVCLIGLIFLLFHLPNIFLRFSGSQALAMVCMLALFGLGQAVLFWRWRNGYLLVLSQAIWGMVLLVHGWT